MVFRNIKLKKKLSIICFNKNQLVGNGLVIPSGPLRENLKSLIDADIVLINGGNTSDFEKKILSINKNLKIFSHIL
jgi:tetraacyldisaccharide 4'-kinase